jgi:hypothetical protein
MEEDHGEGQYTHRVSKEEGMKNINTICRKNAEMSNVKTGYIYIYIYIYIYMSIYRCVFKDEAYLRSVTRFLILSPRTFIR